MLTSCPTQPQLEDFGHPNASHGSSGVGWGKVKVSSINDSCVCMVTGVEQRELVCLVSPLAVIMQYPYIIWTVIYIWREREVDVSY